VVFFIARILPYITVLIFLGGIAWHLWKWTIPRVRHFIGLSPFPRNWGEAVGFIGWQIVSFWNILKFDKGLWVGAWPMHVAIGAIVGGHVLGIYTLGTQFTYIGATVEQSEAASEFLGTFFGIVFLVTLIYLLIRRIASPSVRALSTPSDYLHLVFLIVIATIGNYMRLVPSAHCTYEEARQFLAGLFLFNPQPLPESTFFLYHFLLVQILMIIFPFSKLMHSFGILWERWLVNRPYKEWPMGIPGVKIPLSRDYSSQDAGRQLVVDS